jgi:bile acid:Na+ symporter, BASS family
MFELFFGVVLPASLLVIMMGMGMTLDTAAFKRVMQFPVPVIVGLSAQILLLPAIAFACVLLFDLDHGLALGLILLAACPGGVTSNAWVYVVRADVALSVTLTAINSVILPFSLPLVYMLGVDLLDATTAKSAVVPFEKLVKNLVIMTVIPIGFGMLVRRYLPRIAAWTEPHIRTFSVVILMLIVVFMWIAEYDFFSANVINVGGVILVLMIAAMAAGYFLGAAFSLPEAQRFTILLEVGIQNTVIAVFIAGTVLQDSTLAIVPSTYGMLMMLPIGALMLLRHHLVNRKVAAKSIAE